MELQISGMNAKINVTADLETFKVYGHVCPFIDPFHKVEFAVELQDGEKNCKTSISFGGNTFYDENAFMMIKAANAAHELAMKYASMYRTIKGTTTNVDFIAEAIEGGRIDDASFMIAMSNHLLFKRKNAVNNECLCDEIIRNDKFMHIINTANDGDHQESSACKSLISLLIRKTGAKINPPEQGDSILLFRLSAIAEIHDGMKSIQDWI
ncbi:hypothetical protein D3C87_351240 [compost metagenome]